MPTLAEQFHDAASTARTLANADDVARLLWRAHAEGHLDDDAASAAAEAVEARRRKLRAVPPFVPPKPPRPRRKPNVDRRRQAAMSGIVPAKLAASFTLGEIAVLSVVGREIRRAGRCELPIAAIAAFAGVERTTVQNAVRQGRRVGLIEVTERRRRGAKSQTNVVEALDPLWRAWLARFARFDRVQNNERHGIRIDSKGRTDDENPAARAEKEQAGRKRRSRDRGEADRLHEKP